MASPGHEYLVYLPEGREMTVDLSATAKAFVVEWFDPKSGANQSGATVAGGMRRSFHAPFDNDGVLHLKVSDRKTRGTAALIREQAYWACLPERPDTRTRVTMSGSSTNPDLRRAERAFVRTHLGV